MIHPLGGTTTEEFARIDVDGVRLDGRLRVPGDADSLVVLAGGGAGERYGDLIRHVAGRLDQVRVGTLHVNLVSREEGGEERLRDDVEQLTERVLGIRRWLSDLAPTTGLRTGLFGVDIAGAASVLAAARSERIGAVVSLAGRPDRVDDALEDVHVPTLMIARRNRDREVARNEGAVERLGGEPSRLVSVPEMDAAMHRGFSERVAIHALAWFSEYLSASQGSRRYLSV